MKPKTFLVVSLVVLICQGTEAVESASYRNGRAFVTEGILDNVNWFEEGKTVLTRYHEYDNWALQGLDGKDPLSATYMEQFVSYIHPAPDLLIIVYNINLPWPFGSKGNQLCLKIDESRLQDENLLSMTLQGRQFGVDNASFRIYAEDSLRYPGTKVIRFQLSITFGWFIEKLLSHTAYNNHMQTVMSTLALNLERYAHSYFFSVRKPGISSE